MCIHKTGQMVSVQLFFSLSRFAFFLLFFRIRTHTENKILAAYVYLILFSLCMCVYVYVHVTAIQTRKKSRTRNERNETDNGSCTYIVVVVHRFVNVRAMVVSRHSSAYCKVLVSALH